LKSDFYDVAGFLDGKSSLNNIEMGLLGDIQGKSILHLQCHFGQDSILLSRMGAKVTGVDLADKAIDSARQFADQTKSDAQFICCDIYNLHMHLSEQFDIVYTSYGVIGWLPDLNKLAQLISNFLKPNGKLVFVVFHPLVWMFDDNFEKIAYSYFNSGAIEETESGTYADKEADISQSYVVWNHSLSEVLNSLISNGLIIESMDEFDYSPYNCFNQTVEFEPNKFRILPFDNKAPLVYALVGKKI